MSAYKKLPESVLEYFRKQGQIGGKKRAANLTPEQRSEQARNAVQARWAKKVKETTEIKSPARKGTK